MGKTSLKADRKNAWFHVCAILSALQGIQFTGIFLEALPGGNTTRIVTAGAEAVIFILFALAVIFFAGSNLKRTIIPAALVCLYMSAETYGLIALLSKTLESGSLNPAGLTVLSVLKIAVSVGYIILMIIYILKCCGKFDTRKPLLTAATAVLLLSWALLVVRRLDNNATVINALFTLDLSQAALSVPICFTALTLSLKR